MGRGIAPVLRDRRVLATAAARGRTPPARATGSYCGRDRMPSGTSRAVDPSGRGRRGRQGRRGGRRTGGGSAAVSGAAERADATIAIEAVPENLELKERIFRELDRLCRRVGSWVRTRRLYRSPLSRARPKLPDESSVSTSSTPCP